ncbi:hypothetical protein EV363DRAFT_1150758 [Boletus edulis]|nr:hypothetical protein EV363DRAFT_1150758 [Boletus edulis]
MPLRLIDTYTGLILKRSDITSFLKRRQDYRAKLGDAIREPLGPVDPEHPFLQPKRKHLQTFIAEYLAFAMFSHRWGGRELTIDDVRKATNGIYSIVEPPPHLRGKLADDFLEGAKKLQEFCCVAAKCGYRWAWSDTCCIDEQIYGEKSESLNSMYLWYHSSDLTIVYLGDVDDLEQERLSAGGSDYWFDDVEIQQPFTHSYPYPPEASNAVTTLHDCCRQGSSLQLESVRPDTQVEAAHLEDHLMLNFPTEPGCVVRGKYRNVPIWVTRGWTLQEMLASKRLRFYSKRWTLLEEAVDRDTDEEEDKISVSSFKYRARIVDHRVSPNWSAALERTTEVPAHDLVKFEAGARDVRTRLRWAARRSTTKVEDMAYCLLGIFDVTLPAMYGEGHRAFFRLQEELMKRTADASLFDWCGRHSPINSFLAYEAECFVEPNLPSLHIADSGEFTFRTILDIFRAIFGTLTSGFLAAIREVNKRILHTIKSTSPGHTIINGELNLPLFEHRVNSCERLESPPGDSYFHYKLEVDGLKHTHVTLRSHMPSLIKDTKQYYLCRVWSRHTRNVFQILIELIEYVLKEKWSKFWDRFGDNTDSESAPPDSWTIIGDQDDKPDESDLKLLEEMQTKRRQVLEFFKHPFPVFLVRVKDGRRVRVTTANRVVSDYVGFDFKMPVVTRFVL